MPRQRRIKGALNETSRLRPLVKVGIGAFSTRDVKLIAEDQRPRIGDSLDLDAASKDEHPEANRWDYIVSIPDLQLFAGIEPHSEKDSEVSVVIRKKQHATEYLGATFRTVTASQNGSGCLTAVQVLAGSISATVVLIKMELNWV